MKFGWIWLSSFRGEDFLKLANMMNKLWKIVIKGHLPLKGSIDNFGHINLFVDLTLLIFFAVYSLSLSIIIFKIMTKNCKISLKLPIKWQQPNNWMFDSSENFRADRYWPNEHFYSMSDLLLMLSFLRYKPKTAFDPYVLF